MKTQFVTYEIALKLKELGFDESCLACFTSRLSGKDFTEFWFSDQIWGNSDFHPDVRICKNTDFTNEKSCTAPLWQQVIDWFIDNYNYNIEIRRNWPKLKYFYTIDHPLLREVSTSIYSRKEAREQAILKAIELIKNK